MVTTATLAPSAAAPIAIAAAVVVFPTPPEPAQTTILRSAISSATSAQISPSRTACATAWERLRAFSLVTTSCSTFFTVRSE